MAEFEVKKHNSKFQPDPEITELEKALLKLNLPNTFQTSDLNKDGRVELTN